MTVAELILELQFQPQNLEISIIDGTKKKIQEFRDIEVDLYQPELADNYVAITFTKDKSKGYVTE